MRRDQSWLVEILFGIEVDPGHRPDMIANDAAVVPTRAAANALAEVACHHLQTKGNSAQVLSLDPPMS